MVLGDLPSFNRKFCQVMDLNKLRSVEARHGLWLNLYAQ